MTHEKGVTLIEVLLSITLLSIVIITFLSFFSNAFRFNTINDDSIQAMNIAREQQALIKKLSWSEITTEFTITPEYPDYYIKKVNDDEYVIEIFIKKKKEAGDFYRELHQVHVQVTKEGKLLSETYTYHEGNVVSP